MRLFFIADVYLELNDGPTGVVSPALDALAERFPRSTHVTALRAAMHYNARDYGNACPLFRQLLARDPHRLEDMDLYSNCLFVTEARADLCALAQAAVRIDKFRFQTCCVVFNYYAMKGEHEKAVLSLRRALKLNPNYTAAWTLMGHEYVEMHNFAAAIEAYRRGVDLNPRDFRAWYGLGQAYEVMQMHTYSLYYYSKATNLRPFDPRYGPDTRRDAGLRAASGPLRSNEFGDSTGVIVADMLLCCAVPCCAVLCCRMWCAMGDAYERLGRTDNASQCFTRALDNGDGEKVALNKLAKLFHRKNDFHTVCSAHTAHSAVLCTMRSVRDFASRTFMTE
jgi:anaphase-promoting complex subunit 8